MYSGGNLINLIELWEKTKGEKEEEFILPILVDWKTKKNLQRY